MNTTMQRNSLLLMCSLAVFLGYLLPEWYTYFVSDVNVFVNAWDEETYLSWQGILSNRNSPGYFLLYVNWLLHLAGVSGAMQNLLFDTLLPPIITYIVYRALLIASSDIGKPLAAGYATVILFSSTLFNYTNPLIKYLVGPYNNGGVLMAGWELYPSVLRTPNPQTSYLLIAIAVFWFLKTRKSWLLLVPLPLLYFHVAIPYFFSLLLCDCYEKSKNKFSYFIAVIISFIVTYTLMGLGLAALMYTMGIYRQDHPLRMHSILMLETRQLQFSIILLILFSILFILNRCQLMANNNKLKVKFTIVAAAIIGATNLHIITGYMLCQKNYYDYGISILLGIGTVIIIEQLKRVHLREQLLCVILATLVMATFYSQLTWCRVAVKISKNIAPTIETLRKDPLHAIIPDVDLSSRVAYSTPQLLSPLFSYQYQFIRDHNCREYHALLEKGMAFAAANLTQGGIEILNLEKFVSSVKKYQSEAKLGNGAELSYCKNFDVPNGSFYIIDAK